MNPPNSIDSNSVFSVAKNHFYQSSLGSNLKPPSKGVSSQNPKPFSKNSSTNRATNWTTNRAVKNSDLKDSNLDIKKSDTLSAQANSILDSSGSNKNNVLIGRAAEKIVKDHYLRRGYTFVTENFEYFVDKERGRHGEIDLIFTKKISTNLGRGSQYINNKTSFENGKSPKEVEVLNELGGDASIKTGEIEKVFLVEVKARSQHSQKTFGPTINQITKTKIQLIKTTYQHFLRKNPEYRNSYSEIQVAIVDLDILSVEIFKLIE